MSGHSHWATIKRAKGAADAKKGKIFSKLGKEITIVVKASGGNPDNNPTLRTLLEKAKANPFVAKIGWLGKMMFGGSFLLAIEHVYHGEIIFTPPFLTAVKDGNTADMLHEMATRGVAMAVLIGVVWVAMVAISTLVERSPKLGLAGQEG